MGGLKVLMFMCLLEGVDYWGTIGLYSGGGSVQTLGTDKQLARKIIRVREQFYEKNKFRTVSTGSENETEVLYIHSFIHSFIE